MKKLVVVSAVALMASVMLTLGVNPFALLSATVSADNDKGGGQSDHALWGGGDTNLYCGVRTHIEPWELHISATTDNSAGGGTLAIKFRDGDTISYNIPASSSFSATNTFGGVPGVDDVVQIAPGGGVVSALASARANSGARDPFAGDSEKDNFCLTKPDDPGTLGSPNPWVIGIVSLP